MNGVIRKLARRKRLRVAGLMSGTSADGVDVAVIDIDGSRVHVQAFGTRPYTPGLRRRVLSLCEAETASVDEVCRLNFELGDLFVKALLNVCESHALPIDSVDLIGSHGQTIRHLAPGRRQGSTLQIGEPCIIAERTGICTIADFRPRDMAAGGQGAPLVPFADRFLFRHETRRRVIQNIGGIANLTWLSPRRGEPDLLAFDTGPGNMVIDAVVSLLTHGKRAYDRNGAMAAAGRPDRRIVQQFLGDHYFRRRPPKSTGREYFGGRYAHRLVAACREKDLSREDIVATATGLTARSVVEAYRRFLPRMPDEVILAGGGARNVALVEMLREDLPGIELTTTDEYGIDVDAREAVSFAILAYATAQGLCGNEPVATGARRSVILGKVIPA